MEPTDPLEKIEFWREHVRKAALFEGTQGKYAEQNAISQAKLSYYKGVFNPKPKKPSFTKLVPEIKAEVAATPPTKPPARVTVLDAAWLAAFLRELFK